MNRCCPPSHILPGAPDTKVKSAKTKIAQSADRANPIAQDAFLSASYFFAMLLTLGAFPLLLRASRASDSSETLLSAGCLGIAILVFTVVSFLYYSEQEARLKKYFANMRIATLSGIPLLFWWAFHNAVSGNFGTSSFEWAVVLGLCSSFLLLFIGFVIKLPQKQLLTCYLFLSAALCIYGALLMRAPSNQYISVVMWSAGSIGGLGFVLQTQSEFRKKCQNVEWLLLLSVVLQGFSLLLFSVQ